VDGQFSSRKELTVPEPNERHEEVMSKLIKQRFLLNWIAAAVVLAWPAVSFAVQATLADDSYTVSTGASANSVHGKGNRLARSTLWVLHPARWHDIVQKPCRNRCKICHKSRSTFPHKPCATAGLPFFAKTFRFLSQVNEHKAGQFDTNRDEGYHSPGRHFFGTCLALDRR